MIIIIVIISSSITAGHSDLEGGSEKGCPVMRFAKEIAQTHYCLDPPFSDRPFCYNNNMGGVNVGAARNYSYKDIAYSLAQWQHGVSVNMLMELTYVLMDVA